MARYFLHLHECGSITKDAEGVERASLAEVHAEAVRSYLVFQSLRSRCQPGPPSGARLGNDGHLLNW